MSLVQIAARVAARDFRRGLAVDPFNRPVGQQQQTSMQTYLAPDISMADLKALLPSIGLKVVEEKDGGIAISDGTNFVWAYGNEEVSFARYGGNDPQNILDKIAEAADIIIEADNGSSEDEMSFTGDVSQRFDGENCHAEGKLTIDGKVHEFSCGTSGRDPAQCKLDGQVLPETDPLHERISLFMTDIWPHEDGNWDAHIENNITAQAPTPVQDEDAQD